MIAAFISRILERMARRTRNAPPANVPPPTTGWDARGDGNRIVPEPLADAFIVTHIGGGSGAHFSDRLALDGTLEGFYHDEFAAGFVPRYCVQLPPEQAMAIFEALEGPAVAAMPDNVNDGMTCGGFELRIIIRLQKRERCIWLCNASHPALSPLVARVWQHRPEPFSRELPEF